MKHYQNKPQSKGYRLEKNDIVKFGRVRLRVRDIDYADNDTSTHKVNANNEDDMFGSTVNVGNGQQQ